MNGCVDEILRHITEVESPRQIDTRRAEKVRAEQTFLRPPPPFSHGMWLSYQCIRVVPDVSAHDLHRVVVGALEFSLPLGTF
jgi:hypothetical protein